MFVSDLALSDFRNYAEALVAFTPGVMVLQGANGQGKTNLVEAIGYLASFTSHRVSADTALVRAGTPGAVVRAKAVTGGRATVLELEIIAGRANRARINRTAVKPRELLGYVHCVMFAPEDLALVKGDPGERRRLLDELAVQLNPRLADPRARYDHVLRQRAALLKSMRIRRYPDDVAMLDVWDQQLADLAAQLHAARADVVENLSPHVRSAYAFLAPGGHADLELRTSLQREEESADVADTSLADRYLQALAAARPREIERGVCLVGPHRDELHLTINELPARGYASHGESWSLALALRLGSFELLRAQLEDSPILILDDVFAELDTARRIKLAELAKQAEQVFVTAAVAEDVPPQLTHVTYRVAHGTIERAEGGQ